MLISTYRKVKRSISKKVKSRVLKKRGSKVIHKLEEVLSKAGVVYHFDMGTLLGIVREGALIGHDLDIDIAVHLRNGKEREPLLDTLKRFKIQQIHSYTVETIGVVEDSFRISGVKFDISYYWVDEKNKSICYLLYDDTPGWKNAQRGLYKCVKLTASNIVSTKKIEFAGKEITVPAEPEKLLTERYGDKWRVPDKNYLYWLGPSAEKIPLSGYRKVF